jgi:uncharacterized protein YbgA (DUF1722 family)/uncharacterized protein YbbK (DUF523 family)
MSPKDPASPSTDPDRPIRIGISSCLLGEKVRFDGGHKEDRFISRTLVRYFEYVPVCPEAEAGLGVPREAMRLVGDPETPRLLTGRTKVDRTHAMRRFVRGRVRDLAGLDLDGYIFKKDSPSCGMERVRVYSAESGMAVRRGVGLFARAFMERLPLIPTEEEGRLSDPVLRENFIERVFCHWRWRGLLAEGLTRGRLVAFHTAHKLTLLAHSPKHYQELGRLVAEAKGQRASALAAVLMHIAGYFKRELAADEKTELLGVIEDYRCGLVPLIVPITLIRHYVRKFDVTYLRGQVYLNPHPKELMLRNHV